MNFTLKQTYDTMLNDHNQVHYIGDERRMQEIIKQCNPNEETFYSNNHSLSKESSKIFEELIPCSGMTGNVLLDDFIVISKIGYRYYNDGDVNYDHNGKIIDDLLHYIYKGIVHNGHALFEEYDSCHPVKCDECDCTGDVTDKCSSCNGDGEIEVQYDDCDHGHTEKCDTCYGSGEEYSKCEHCDGEGENYGMKIEYDDHISNLYQLIIDGIHAKIVEQIINNYDELKSYVNNQHVVQVVSDDETFTYTLEDGSSLTLDKRKQYRLLRDINQLTSNYVKCINNENNTGMIYMYETYYNKVAEIIDREINQPVYDLNKIVVLFNEGNIDKARIIINLDKKRFINDIETDDNITKSMYIKLKTLV